MGREVQFAEEEEDWGREPTPEEMEEMIEARIRVRTASGEKFSRADAKKEMQEMWDPIAPKRQWRINLRKADWSKIGL